jgi:hypothetical protein
VMVSCCRPVKLRNQVSIHIKLEANIQTLSYLGKHL